MMNALLEEIITDAYGEDEQLWAFRQAIEDGVPLPVEGLIIGESVSVTKVDYDGNPQHGLRASCQKLDGKTYTVSLADVEFSDDSTMAPYVKAYRQWLGVVVPSKSRRALMRERIKQTKAGVGQIDISKPVELIVLGIKQETARCKVLETGKELTLRSAGVWKVAPGEIIMVVPKKHWSYAGHPYLSGDVTGSRLDIAALNLTPLKLSDNGIWDPDDEYWGEEEDPLPAWAKEIVDRGPRSEYRMEHILPAVRPEDLDVDSDSIIRAIELKNNGEGWEAERELMALTINDLRCLDAHAHLGNFDFEGSVDEALRHYNVGRQIGELSLGSEFAGVLRWADVDNRPYLRCLHGYGLCLWRLKRFNESADVFTRMLWLNPSDNQGVRFLLDDVRAGEPWENRKDQ